MDAKLAEADRRKEWVQDQKKKTDELVQQLQTQKLDPSVKKPLANGSNRCNKSWMDKRIRKKRWPSSKKR